MSIWDDPALEPPPDLAFVKLENVGDGFTGRVVEVNKQNFDDKDGVKVVPQVTFIDDATGEMRLWTVGQTDARRKLAELRPENGDQLRVQFTGTTGKFKHIDVQVQRLAALAPPPPMYQPAAAQQMPQPTYQPAVQQMPQPMYQPAAQQPQTPAHQPAVQQMPQPMYQAVVQQPQTQLPVYQPAPSPVYQPAPPPVYATGGNGSHNPAPVASENDPAAGAYMATQEPPF